MTVFHIIVIMFRYYCKFWFDFDGINDSFFLGLQITILIHAVIHITKHINITAASISVSNF